MAAGLITAGAGSSIWRIIVATIRQRTTPAPLLGRVYAASRVISWGALPLGSVLAGITAASLGPQAALHLATLIAVGCVLFFLLAWRQGTLGDPTTAAPHN